MQTQLLLLLLIGLSYTKTAMAQHSGAGKKVTYNTVLELPAGEKFEKLLSCWQQTPEHKIASVVIRKADGSLYAIENGIKKEVLTQDKLLSQAACTALDRSTMPRYSQYHFAQLQPDNSYRIGHTKQPIGMYDKILFMRETDTRFAAVVSKKDKKGEQLYYVDTDGKVQLLTGRPVDLITNHDITRAAVILAPTPSVPVETVNQMPREKQVEFFEKMNANGSTYKAWLNTSDTFSIAKNSRLAFDVSGLHFLEAQRKPQLFIDGKVFRVDVSGNGTAVYVNKAGDHWAYYYLIYLSFDDKFTVTDALQPFMVEENGKDYLHWYKIDDQNGRQVLLEGTREL